MMRFASILLLTILPFAAIAADAPATKNSQPAAPSIAVLQLLNKVTARSTMMDAPLMQPIYYGTLSITAKACWVAPKDKKSKQAALLEIRETLPDTLQRVVFSGWMFASSPALSAMEHAVYDVSVKGCK